jgi:hypothetical protein
VLACPAAAEAGTAIFVSQGAGQITMTGTTQSLNVGCDWIASAGVFNWLGTGSFVTTAFSESRTIAIAGAYS